MPNASDHLNALETATFDREVLGSSVPYLVDFTAAWCPPCRALEPIVRSVATELAGQLRVGTVDLDAQPELAVRFGVRGAPTLILFAGGREVARQLGLTTRKRLLEMVQSGAAGHSISGTTSNPASLK
jgi:thioredoxin 1